MRAPRPPGRPRARPGTEALFALSPGGCLSALLVCAIARPTATRARSLEGVEHVLRDVAVGRLVPVLLPHLGPGPAVVVDEVGIGAGQLLRTAVHVLDVAEALDEGEPRLGVGVERLAPEAVVHDDRLGEGVR